MRLSKCLIVLALIQCLRKRKSKKHERLTNIKYKPSEITSLFSTFKKKIPILF